MIFYKTVLDTKNPTEFTALFVLVNIYLHERGGRVERRKSEVQVENRLLLYV